MIQSGTFPVNINMGTQTGTATVPFPKHFTNRPQFLVFVSGNTAVVTTGNISNEYPCIAMLVFSVSSIGEVTNKQATFSLGCNNVWVDQSVYHGSGALNQNTVICTWIAYEEVTMG